MRIDFDQLDLGAPRGNGKLVLPIRVEIQSPVYSAIARDVSVGHIGRDVEGIAGVVDLPHEMGLFIRKEIEK